MERDVETLIPMGYAEHAPPPDLASRVVCFWTRLEPGQATGEATPPRFKRVPFSAVFEETTSRYP